MKKIASLMAYSVCLTYAIGQQTFFDNGFLNAYEIVLLGEQTHGDGAVFENKLEMVKELHEKGGYNLLVFESGMYDNFKANQLYKSNKEDITIFKQSVGWLYSDTQVFQNLLSYIETHPELKILGFDNQESTLFETYFLEDLRKLCAKNNISISEEDYTLLDKTLVFRDVENYINNPKDSIALYDKINGIYNKIKSLPRNNIETKILVQTYKSAYSDMDHTLKYHQKEKSYIQNPRDKQMAENLMFLKEAYPNEKIIGWGASYHFANHLNEFEYTELTESYIKNIFSITESLANSKHSKLENEIEQVKELSFARPMGQILKEKYRDKLFSLAFTSYSGNYWDYVHDTTLPIQKPPANSFEHLFQQEKKEKLHMLSETEGKLYASVLGYIPLYADWATVFDGIYYIEKMYPPRGLNYGADKESLTITNKLNGFNGTVLDAETLQPIAYADIYYSFGNQSTVADSNGVFRIPTQKNAKNQLVFSGMGYVNDTIPIQELRETNTVHLKRSKEDIVLDEVVVTAKFKELSAEEIVKRARKNIESNYVQTPYNQTFHFSVRDFDTKDSINVGEEAIIDTYNKKGINGSNKVENGFFGEIQHLRNNTDKYDKVDFGWGGIGGLWALLNRDIILSKTNVLYRTSSYNLTKEGTLNYDGRRVQKISFVNNSPGAYSTGIGFPSPKTSNGIIYIDSENYAILKYVHCIYRGVYESKVSEHNVETVLRIGQSYKKVGDLYFSNLLEFTTFSKVYAPDNTYLSSAVRVQKLVSNNIRTNNVNVIKKRLLDLKKGFTKKTDDTFWNDRPIDFNIEFSSGEICRSGF